MLIKFGKFLVGDTLTIIEITMVALRNSKCWVKSDLNYCPLGVKLWSRKIVWTLKAFEAPNFSPKMFKPKIKVA